MNETSAAFIEAVKKYRNILIYISGSPDPDALASSHALKIVLEKLSIDSEIMMSKKLSLPQNKEFVKLLKIPVRHERKTSPARFDAYIIPDFQSNVVKELSGVIPCAAHIDHHKKSTKIVESDFSLIDEESGSTSTLVAMMLQNMDIILTKNEKTSIATALMYGIQTDTDSYEHTSNIDIEALKYISEFANRKLINKINGIPLSPETIAIYRKALNKQVIYKDWEISGVGYVDIKNRDSIAIVADLMLKRSEFTTVVVFAIIEDREKNDLFIDACFRTKSSNLDLNALIKGITHEGGGRKYKGAYQVKLRYFYNCRNREALADLIDEITIEKIKKSRDGNYINEIRGLYENIVRKASNLLKNK